MLKFILPVLTIATFSSCGKIQEMNDLVNGSTWAIYENTSTIQQDTAVIQQNAVLIEQSTETMRENHRVLIEAAGH